MFAQILMCESSCDFCSIDVNVAFQQAAHKVLLDDDNLLPLLHLTVDYQGKDSKGLKFITAGNQNLIVCITH